MTSKKKLITPFNLCCAMFIMGFGVGIADGLLGGINHFPGWVWAIQLIILMGVSVLYWRIIDETAKEAHKFAWYWGSIIGIALILTFCIFSLAGLNSLHLFAWLLPETPTPDDIFFLGITSTLLTQTICYAIVWSAWWLRMR